MTIRYAERHAILEGHVAVDDAEALGSWLAQQERPAVHLGDCESVHAAVLQVLMAFEPALDAPPADPWLAAALGRSAAQPEAPAP